ncbi:MAG TPA: tRNA pseudouridine(13) synthase TruD [Candidatus Bathyarchaeia archaeon]|nr:tRNA pseudouridine(13) synthase TruD [Candidatus Bathyarchaeia archaeon]
MSVEGLFVPEIEQSIGIEVYATDSLGIGGVIKKSIEDFLVEEMLVDHSLAEIIPSKDVAKRQVLGSSPIRDRYLLCVLVKRDWDTFIALRKVAEQLGINTDKIQIAGIKDAKAVTAQHVTIEDVSAEDVQRIRVKDIEIRPIGYLHNELSSYYLLGNSFQVTIHAISHVRSTVRNRITKTVEKLKTIGGVPNFFGHQRFGTTRPITHLVGKAIIKGNLEKAAMLFLAEPFPSEHQDSRQARERLKTTLDFNQALSTFPKQLRYERFMLTYLVEKPDDFSGAFRTLPIRLRELFVQAYQSYLFNKFLSKRIEGKLSLNKVEVGDQVVSVDRSGLPMTAMSKMVTDGNLGEINRAIHAGKMRLAFPLVGFKQRFSLGVQGETEKHVLEEEDVNPQEFKIKTMPEVSSRGGLRTATTPLNNFSLQEIADASTKPSRRKAKVNFVLNRGSYATVVLRELIKPRNPIKAGF